MNRIPTIFVFFLSILFCENSIFPGRQKNRKVKIKQCYACKKPRNVIKDGNQKTQIKKHLFRCDKHHRKYLKKLNNLITLEAMTGETTENPSFFSYTEFCLKKYENQIPQPRGKPHTTKPKDPRYYRQTQCCACQKTTFAKKQFGLCQLKNQLMHHHILCMEFNNKYLNELREGNFFETSLRDYAKRYADNLITVNLKNLNNN